jgi:hypothetical protein
VLSSALLCSPVLSSALLCSPLLSCALLCSAVRGLQCRCCNVSLTSPCDACQVERVLAASHTESTFKDAVVKTTWQKEASNILKKLFAVKRSGLSYADPFMHPVDPIA